MAGTFQSVSMVFPFAMRCGLLPNGEVGRAKEGDAPSYSPHAQEVSLSGEEQIMSDKNSDSGAAPLVVDVLRDRCNVQNESLKSWHQRARLIPAAVMSLGALLAVADLSPGEGLVRDLLSLGLVLVVFVIIAELIANRWNSGPDSGALVRFVTDDLSARDAEIELATKLASQIQGNERVMERVKVAVSIELAVGTGGVLWLVIQLF